jgi:hypothetical protein
MEHFEIILALSRSAISGDVERVTHHVTRLRDALAVSDARSAEKLTRLLNREERRQTVAPMALEQMRLAAEQAVLPGEHLGKNTPLPHDRETGTPLARVLFPEDNIGTVPVLAPALSSAIEDLIGEWAQTEQLAALGVRPNMRCLLCGPPGVGKTMLAHYIGAQLKLPLVEARLDSLVSSFLGTSARNIGSLFDFASRYRCILFLDEFDAIAKARDDSQEIGEIKRVVNTLLQCLDARGHRGFTLAATNHDHLLDQAVWRRFEGRIELLRPDRSARKALLQRFLPPITLSDPELRMLTWLTEGMSAADLETLIAGGKRFLVMHNAGGGNTNGLRSRQHILLAALRRQATLNGRMFGRDQQGLLLGSKEVLAAALVDLAGLTQSEAGTIVGVSQSTISRRRRSSSLEDVDELAKS